MASYSRSLFDRPAAQPLDGDAVPLGELLGEVAEVDPVWAEGSDVFHTRARCSRLAEIAVKNRRHQPTEPLGKTLCAICRAIILRGRKG